MTGMTVEAVRADRARIVAAVQKTLRLRLTGEQLDQLPEGTNREDFFIDFDEWEEWVPLSLLMAIITPDRSPSLACMIDLRCYRNDGHDGDHMFLSIR